MIFVVLAIAYVVIAVLDVLSTQASINSGNGVEANPVMAKLFGWLPSNLWWLPKLAVLPIIAALWFAGWAGVAMLAVLDAVGIYLVINNYRIARG